MADLVKIERKYVDAVVKAAYNLKDRFEHHLPPHQQVKEAHDSVQDAVRELKGAAESTETKAKG